MRRAAWLRLAVLAAGVGGAFALVALALGHSTADVRDAVSGLGAWAPIAFVALSAVLSVAVFPFPVLGGAAGLLFGIPEGTVVATAGNVVGACLCLEVSRHGGRKPVEQLAGPRVAEALRAVGDRGFQAVLLLRVTPGISGAAVSYACGLTRVGVAPFALATVIGNAPRSYAYVALGGSLGDFGNTQSIVAIALLTAIGLVGAALVARDPQVRAAVRARREARRAARRG